MYQKAFLILMVVLASSVLTIGPAAALKNPSAVYCEALGYTYTTVTAPDGGVTGQCRISATEQVSAWKFLTGDEAQDKSYCAKQGLQYRKVTDPAVCKVFGLDTCMVCVLPDGKTTEVTALMNLSFEEGVCGDGTCAMSENTGSCPKDCPSGAFDGYCDGDGDGKCDPDCPAGRDADCNGGATGATPQESPQASTGFWIALLAVGGTALLFIRGRD
jgi:putative hemolysin